MEQGRVSVVPRRLIRRTALVACTGPFSSLGENPEDFAKDVGRNWSSGPAVNLIVRLPDVGLPVLSNLKLNSDVSCTHGNYWTIFPFFLIGLTASVLQFQTQVSVREIGSGLQPRCLPELVDVQTVNQPVPFAAGPRRWIWPAWKAYAPNGLQRYCAVTSLVSDCFATGNF
jgi:hypothetical protein